MVSTTLLKPICYSLAIALSLSSSVSGGVSRGPSGVRTTYTPAATSTQVHSLCSPNAAQCCNSTNFSNSSTAEHLFTELNITKPHKVVDVGFECLSLTDNEVREGTCGEFLFCCHKVYNSTLFMDNFGVNCTDLES